MKPISRRNFIRTGTAMMSMPFIEGLPELAMAANATGSQKRILFFCLSNAWYPDVVFPSSTNYSVGPEGVRYIPLNSIAGDISQLFTSAKYGALKSKMNIMRGFDLLGGALGGHDLMYALGACKEGGVTENTIDTIISNSSQFYPTPPAEQRHRNMCVSPVVGEHVDNKYNYSFVNGDYRGYLQGPTQIFQEFFTGTLPTAGVLSASGFSATSSFSAMSISDPNISRRVALTNAMKKVASMATSTKFTAQDRDQLIRHQEILSNMLPGLAAPTPRPTPVPTPTPAPVPAPVPVGTACMRPAKPSGINENMSSQSGNQARLRNVLSQIYMAFNCQITNMAVIHPIVAADMGVAFMGDAGVAVADGEYHQLAGHRHDVPKYLAQKGWLFDQLLYLLNMMEATKESNGLSMLDNSLVVVVSNDACSIHSYEDIPIITFGSLGGTMKTGSYINYQRLDAPASTGGFDQTNGVSFSYKYNLGRPFGSFYTTLLNILKIPHTGFGSYTDPQGVYSQFTSAAGKQASLPLLV